MTFDNSAWSVAETKPDKAKGTKDSDAQSMVTQPDKQLTPADVLAKREGNLEWVDEKDDEYQL